MKIAIISDVHANLAALSAFPKTSYDALWCVGDLVDYGPRPHEVIQEVRNRVDLTVCGNHDYAAGSSADPQCSPPFKRLAAETRRYTQQVCSTEDLEFLRALPVCRQIKIGATRFYVVHAIPTNPLFGYCAQDSDQWQWEVEGIQADVLVVGHTHTPFVRTIGNTVIVNPGSLGQPKTGRPLACYAVWEDGSISLKEYEYPIEETIRDIRRMPIAQHDQDGLIGVLRTGRIPPPHASSSADTVVI
jgi:putative phosphoesterase